MHKRRSYAWIKDRPEYQSKSTDMTIKDVLEAFWKWQDDERYIGYLMSLDLNDYLKR